jgi:hypothetical protein
LLVALHHDGAVRADLCLAAGVRLGHLPGAAQLDHECAAVVLLGGHHPFRNRACQQRGSRPVERQERKRDGGTTTHVESVGGWRHGRK